MNTFSRPYPLFSLCGLNCALCPMHIDRYCPGCGGGAGNQPCKIARCSQQRGNVEYCTQCGEYPCGHYDGIDAYDSFIAHRHQLKDLDRAQMIGLSAYQAELDEKVRILRHLLENYNDGRKKSFYCLAVNLLPLDDLKDVAARLEADARALPVKEKAAAAAALLHSKAEASSLLLKLNRKPARGR